jgi:hypothetical protein
MGKLKDLLISQVEDATAKLCEQHNIDQSFPGDQQSAEIHDMHIEGELKTAINGYINHNFNGINKSEVFQVIKLISEIAFEKKSENISKLHNDQNDLVEDV